VSYAAENGQKAVVQLLLATDGVDPDSKDRDDRTPLLWTVDSEYWGTSGYKHVEVVKLLLATQGVNPNSRYVDGQTPLSRGAQSRREAMFKLLLANSVNLDSKDNHGITLLSWAARTRHDAAANPAREGRRCTRSSTANCSYASESDR
jgi:ankyrin repeat protein